MSVFMEFRCLKLGLTIAFCSVFTFIVVYTSMELSWNLSNDTGSVLYIKLINNECMGYYINPRRFVEGCLDSVGPGTNISYFVIETEYEKIFTTNPETVDKFRERYDAKKYYITVAMISGLFLGSLCMYLEINAATHLRYILDNADYHFSIGYCDICHYSHQGSVMVTVYGKFHQRCIENRMSRYRWNCLRR